MLFVLPKDLSLSKMYQLRAINMLYYKVQVPLQIIKTPLIFQLIIRVPIEYLSNKQLLKLLQYLVCSRSIISL